MSRPPDQLPSKRKRQTPAEAAAEREQQRRAEAADRARREQLRKEASERAARARLQAGPVTDANRRQLDNIAINLHNAYDWKGHDGECVTAVVQSKRGMRLTVFAQRFMTAMETYAGQHYADKDIVFKPGGGSHLHAEMYAVLDYLLQELHPGEHIGSIGVSKPICPQCAEVLDHLGIDYDSRWITADLSNNWKDPWSLLPKTCKPPVRGPHEKREEDDDDNAGGKRPRLGPGVSSSTRVIA